MYSRLASRAFGAGDSAAATRQSPLRGRLADRRRRPQGAYIYQRGKMRTTDETSRAVGLLADRTEISEKLSEFFRGFDTKRLDRAWVEGLFSYDAVLDFPITPNCQNHRVILEEMQRLASWWKATRHLTTDHLVEIAGDNASLRANVLATHIHPDDDPRPVVRNFVHGGTCDLVCVRTPKGWRITRFTLTVLWVDGDPPTAVLQYGPPEGVSRLGGADGGWWGRRRRQARRAEIRSRHICLQASPRVPGHQPGHLRRLASLRQSVASAGLLRVRRGNNGPVGFAPRSHSLSCW